MKMKYKKLYEILTNHRKDEMLEFMNENPTEFTNLAELALSDESIFSWRAAWLLKNCSNSNDERLQKFTNSFIETLLIKSESQQREFLKILLTMDLDDEQEGILYDKCTVLWKEIHKKPAIRYNAMAFLVKTAQKYPELINEIKLLSNEHYIEPLSPGIKHSLKKMINKIE
jgi:hypothetical protein